jgi:hypothetical protein
MVELERFLQSLEVGNNIAFILPCGLISGNVKTKYDHNIECIEISDIRMSGNFVGVDMTIPAKIILAWGMKVKVNSLDKTKANES